MDRPTPETKPTDLRERLIEAVIAETAEFGHAGASVERILSKAGVTSAVFYSHFSDQQAAVEAAFDCLFERYMERLLQACRVQPDWPLKVKVGIGVTLDMAAASPVAARFLVETIGGALGFPDGMLDARDRLARFLVAGRIETPLGAELPGVLEAALVGGVAGVISAQLRADEAKRLPALAPELVELTLTPYLGRDEAAKLARRPRPRFEGE